MYSCLQLSKAPYGPLSEYQHNVSPGLDVSHLADAYVLNTIDDMFCVKESCIKNEVPLPLMIVTAFDVLRYPEANSFVDSACPDVVANVFMDYVHEEPAGLVCKVEINSTKSFYNFQKSIFKIYISQMNTYLFANFILDVSL